MKYFFQILHLCLNNASKVDYCLASTARKKRQFLKNKGVPRYVDSVPKCGEIFPFKASGP
jgi:hypothetical protein